MVKGAVTPTHAVDRPALRRQLDEALTQPLTLVVAPAGAGKSVLLAQWAATHPDLDVIWMDLTRSDDDPVRFAQRLLAGLATVNAEAAELGTLVSLHSGGLGTPLLEAVTGLMAELPETVLVLDDLHQLSNAKLLADLGRLVEHLPANIHLVLSTRVDPPFAWSRHRLGRGLTEIRQAELAFDQDDSARLLERITGQPLGQDQVEALVHRTEGWAAGLQVAGMMLRLHEDPDRFVAHFSGSDRLIADYLSEEVLEAQPEPRRVFLLECSVLDEMCADLVAHLTGVPDAQLVLEELERESMFLLPLDGHREWYRFHHLFRDLLRFRLRAEDPDAEARLLALAAAWHLDRGEVAPAIEYLLRARAWDEVLELIMHRGTEVFERGQMATVVRWITAVPETKRTGRREVSLLLGLLKGAEGQAAGAEDILRGLLADPGATPGERACAQAFLATMAQFRTNPDTTVQMALAALAMLRSLAGGPMPVVINLSDPQSLETMVLGSGGRAHFLAGRMDEARAWMEEGLASPGAAYSAWRIGILGSLGLVEAWVGRLERAQAVADEALSVARDVGILTHPVTADAFLATSLVALQRGRARHAALALGEGTLRAEANRRTPLTWVCRLMQAELQAAEGQSDQAAATMVAARHELGAPPPPVVEHGLLALRSRLLRVSGFPDEAHRLLREAPPEEPALVFEAAANALARGHSDQARKILEGAAATSAGRPSYEVERLLAQAWLSLADGDLGDSRRQLKDAMDLASLHGLVAVFVRAGPDVVRMVAEHEDGSPEFRHTVLVRAREALDPVRGDLPDPLTDRELEILSYLPSRLTNTELAERCYVSVNTIKTHMAHIYRKLDAANRNEAITRARQLGLL